MYYLVSRPWDDESMVYTLVHVCGNKVTYGGFFTLNGVSEWKRSTWKYSINSKVSVKEFLANFQVEVVMSSESEEDIIGKIDQLVILEELEK